MANPLLEGHMNAGGKSQVEANSGTDGMMMMMMMMMMMKMLWFNFILGSISISLCFCVHGNVLCMIIMSVKQEKMNHSSNPESWRIVQITKKPRSR